jgi:hypothetical protein
MPAASQPLLYRVVILRLRTTSLLHNPFHKFTVLIIQRYLLPPLAMSHHNYPNHGRPFSPSPTGGNSHGGSSYLRQDAIKPMTFLQKRRPPTRSLIPFRTSYITMRRRMFGSVFDIVTFYAGPHASMCIPLQVPPAPGHGEPEGHHEEIPPPAGGVAGPGRVQDPHRTDVAYQGILDFRPQPLVVSTFHLLLPSLLIINDIRAIEPCIYGCRTRPMYPGTSATQCFSGYRLCFLDTFSRYFATGESRAWPLWSCSPACGARPSSACLSSYVCSRYPYSQPTKTRGSPTTCQSLLVPPRCTGWHGQCGSGHHWPI